MILVTISFSSGSDAGVSLKVVQTHLVVICNFGRIYVCCVMQTVIYIFCSAVC